ncbi:hypothetical protein HPP92_016120 [Vanilla planifolia]|uniref:Uncharacterized protein n=1 Tax=Vanilla planifolia TaxID=51239 RepID=A0A835UQY7_VANPL|nr:hypothetical protein HPP92_016120 [Vanilla planifolia]
MLTSACTHAEPLKTMEMTSSLFGCNVNGIILSLDAVVTFRKKKKKKKKRKKKKKKKEKKEEEEEEKKKKKKAC